MTAQTATPCIDLGSSSGTSLKNPPETARRSGPIDRLHMLGGKAALCYSVTLVAFAVTAVVREVLDPLLLEHHPFILFLAPTFLAAWLGGWKPASLILVVGYLTAAYFFVHPRGSFAISDVENLVGLAFYLGVGGVGIVMSENVRIAKQRAEAQSLRLCNEIIEHHRTQNALRKAQAELEERVQQRTADLSTTNEQLRQESAAR